ncbi:MAG TPA: M48 family metalloprotease, partial [Tepidisphaeraceae bacterium]|nr:M48 family metalloprotease [Tepidisphaeraceae bacterium]
KQYVAMNVDQEKALGLEAAPKMAAEMGGAADPNRDPDARVVSETGFKIVKATEASKSPYSDNFHFFLLNDPKTVNAFALPGGQIFITRALYDRLENEAQLAGVLGHETGHVIGRHSAQQMAKGKLGQMLAGAAGVAASDRGQGGAIAAQMVNQMMQLKYSRKDELEADNFGLRYMSQAAFDPREMLRVMRILKQASGGGGRGPDIFATHPDPDARIAAIQEWLDANAAKLPRNLTTGRPLHSSSDRFTPR